MSITKNTPHILKHSGLSFTTVINKTLDCIKCNAALGIYVYLASKPADWEISETNLQNRFGKGRDHIRAKLAELKLIGLIKSVAIKDTKGRIIRWETILYSEPQIQVTENPSSGEMVHITEKPHSGKPRGLENPPTTNKGSKQIKDLNKPPISPKGNESRFEEFWELYPKKKAKDHCFTKWRQKKLDDIADKIIEKLRDQVSLDEEWIRGYAPNPLTYINQSRWKDEISKPKPANTSKPPAYDENDTSWIEEMAL